jgi:hypothetical protein
MSAMKWRKSGVYVLVLVPVLGLGGIAVIAAQQTASAQQGNDPAADAARKAREQKKTEPKPKKVYTNDDIGGGSTASAPAPGNTAPAPAAGATTAVTDTKDGSAPAATGESSGATKSPAPDKNDEASWRAKFSETRGQLAQAEKELDILQREAQKAQVQFYSDPATALKEQYSRKDVNEKDTKIAAKKQEIDQLKQKLSDMEDTLRRSGGDVGWARQ